MNNSTQIQQQIDRLERRREDLQARHAELASGISANTNARARALASGEPALPLAASVRLQDARAREEIEVVTLAIAQLEAQLAPLQAAVVTAVQAEERAAAERERHAALEEAKRARNAMRAELRAFLDRFAALSAQAQATDLAGRTAQRRLNQVRGLSQDDLVQDGGWGLERFANSAEANIVQSLEQLVRNRPNLPRLFEPML